MSAAYPVMARTTSPHAYERCRKCDTLCLSSKPCPTCQARRATAQAAVPSLIPPSQRWLAAYAESNLEKRYLQQASMMIRKSVKLAEERVLRVPALPKAAVQRQMTFAPEGGNIEFPGSWSNYVKTMTARTFLPQSLGDLPARVFGFYVKNGCVQSGWIVNTKESPVGISAGFTSIGGSPVGDFAWFDLWEFGSFEMKAAIPAGGDFPNLRQAVEYATARGPLTD